MLELIIVLALVALGVAAGLQASAATRNTEEAERNRPLQTAPEPYVTSGQCRSCHPTHYDSWFGSYHRTMTQLATPASVIGEFAGVELAGHRLSQEGGRYYVEVPAVTGPPERHPITLVTGSHHMQVYWYETGVGRALAQLPFGFLKEERRWVPRASMFIEPPGEVRPPEIGRWNNSCIACHTTGGRPRADAHGEYDTQVTEFGIACEACHGPGGAHVDKQASPLARYTSHFGSDGDSSIVHPGKLDHERASAICSQCHAMWQHRGTEGMQSWNLNGFAYRPGGDPKESMWLLQPSRSAEDERVAWVTKNRRSYVDGQFWRDGQARVSGREYSGMIDSPCYLKGELSCLSCHSMHKPAADRRAMTEWANDQLKPGMQGDKACVQCHSEIEERLSEHTRHAADSSGSRCMNCHMPYTSYGLLTAMRSHRIDVPDVRATVEAGRPNACTSCHLDRTLGWAAEQLQAKWGIAPPELDEDERTVDASLLLGMKGDAGQRALVAWSLGWPAAVAASPAADLAPLLGVLMDDPYDAVRYVAERSLRAHPALRTSARGLAYDYVTPPSKRTPIAPRVAGLGQQPSAAARKKTEDSIARLKPLRDHRQVLLLE
jgi:hypothetical protein